MKRSFNLSWAIFACFFGLLAILELLVFAYYASPLAVFVLLWVYVGGVVFSLSFLCYVLGFLGQKVFSGAISLFFVLAMACSKMNLNNFAISLPEIVIAIFLILSFSALFFLFLHMEKKRLFPTLGLYVATAFILVSYPIFLIFEEIHADSKESVEEESVKLKNTLADWSGIKFSEKPHIFIISHDSMIPQETAEQYMGIKPAYQAVLDKEFIEFKKGVVLRVPSRASLNAVMRLDQASLERSDKYFVGDRPSVLGAIAHANGYKIVTGFSDSSWRRNDFKPLYIDEFLYSKAVLKRSSVCIDVGDNALLESRGYFFCKHYKTIHRYFPAFTRIFVPNKKGWKSIIYNHIRNLPEDDPHISFFYIYTPIGHTKKGFNYNNANHLKEYKKMFSSQSEKLALELKTLVALIKEKHPDSILLVFGDHGAKLSNGLNPSTAQELEFSLKDRHRVAVALMKTENRCVKSFQVDENRDYYTPSMVLVELFECLESTKVLPSLIDYDEHKKELLLEHAF